MTRAAGWLRWPLIACGDSPRGREIGIAQGDAHLRQLVEREFDLALDDRPGGDARRGRHPLGDAFGLAFGSEAADRERSLADRVDLAIGAVQRGDEQKAAPQRLGVTQRAHRDVHARALAGERRQRGGDHHRGDVLGREVETARADPEALEHRLQALLGEGGVAQRVAGAVEADHQAVADQKVVAHPFEIGDVLEARVGQRGRRQQQTERKRAGRQQGGRCGNVMTGRRALHG